MNKKYAQQNVKLYLNDKGEIIEPTESLLEELNPCVNTISLCCTSTVPDGYTIDTDIIPFNVCFDFSDLKCCLETQSTTCDVPNPCDGTLTCPVEIQAVRLLGSARMVVNAGSVRPISNPDFPCNICCNTTTSADQIIGFTCGKKPPCENCFSISTSSIIFKIVTDDCGRQVLVAQAELHVMFTGCSG